MTIFRVIPDKSTIEIKGTSSVHPLTGSAHSLQGTIQVELGADGLPDLSKPYKAELTLPVSAISWGGHLYDRETRRRLDVDRFPTIKVSVEQADRVGQDGQFKVKVKMTMRGQSRVIDGQAAVHVEGSRLVIEGERVIDIREFGMEPPKILMLKVDPRVAVKARVVAEAVEA